MVDRERLKEIVRKAVERRLQQTSGVAGTRRLDHLDGPARERTLIVEADVLEARRIGRPLRVPFSAIITPLARDAASRYGIGIEQFHESEAPANGVEGGAVRPVALAADHAGFELKEMLEQFLSAEASIPVLDLGTHSAAPVDYPDFAGAVARAVASGRCPFGVVVDAVGIGSAIAANKVRGVRAAHCTDLSEAKNARSHNDANVLCLGGRTLGQPMAKAIALVFLKTDFEGGRHLARIEKIARLEGERCTSDA
jgi:ribose 5-phosphate isomerase B